MPLSKLLCLGSTPAIQWASKALQTQGFTVTQDTAEKYDTLLLDIPSFRKDGTLRSGEDPEILKPLLSEGITVIGGNLGHPILAGITAYDLLTDDTYLAGNAAITAQCVIPIAASTLSVTLQEAQPLIIGWGRIGKCLAQLLKGLGAQVTVCARKKSDRAILSALGYKSIDASKVRFDSYRLVINTAPVALFDEGSQQDTRESVLIDLASEKVLPGKNVLWARGLPGTCAPESSGRLIAQTILRLIEGG